MSVSKHSRHISFIIAIFCIFFIVLIGIGFFRHITWKNINVNILILSHGYIGNLSILENKELSGDITYTRGGNSGALSFYHEALHENPLPRIEEKIRLLSAASQTQIRKNVNQTGSDLSEVEKAEDRLKKDNRNRSEYIQNGSGWSDGEKFFHASLGDTIDW